MSSFSPIFWRFVALVLRHTWARLHPVQVEGLEHFPALGPAVICPRHQRWEDILTVAMALPRIHYNIAKVELFSTPFWRKFFLALGAIPVDRQDPRATLSSFRGISSILQQKAYVVLYPEGKIVRDRIGPGKHGLIRMLLKIQDRTLAGKLPFVPVGMSYYFPPRSSRWSVTVRLGKPLSASGSSQAQALTQNIMEEIARLCQGPERW